jgi:NOL1/NOP2/sun family putative RNA methylase
MQNAFELYKDFIPDFQALLESLKLPWRSQFRVNTLRADPISVIKTLEAQGLVVVPEIEGLAYSISQGIKLGNLIEYKLGHIYPQAVTATLAGLVLDPQPDSFVLDLCAAPGSKTTHMAQLMNNTGLIVANELFHDRLPSLGQNIYRFGVINTIITSYQAQEFPKKNQFDFIMADVPCSSEGNFKLTTNKKLHQAWGIEKLQTIQKKIIKRAYDLLKPGGVMLYSTCTYNPMENEAVVNHLLNISDARLLEINPPIPSEKGLLNWKGESFHPSIRLCRRFYPHQTGSVGFFMAKILKPL